LAKTPLVLIFLFGTVWFGIFKERRFGAEPGTKKKFAEEYVHKNT
jgi:hypothetical protein